MFIERFWPWSEIARLKSDVAGYEEEAERYLHEARMWSKLATERQAQIDRQSATLREKNEEIDALKLAASKAGSEMAKMRADLAKFDHDGDGLPGGSKKRGG